MEANGLASRGVYERALALYEEAIGRDPGDERGHCGAAVALLAMGRHEEAIARVEDLIRLRPGAAYPYGVMGCLMEMAGRNEDAAACFGRMIEIDPDEMFGRLRRSLVLAMLGKNERAQECLDEMLAVEPSSASAERDKEKIIGIIEYDGPEKEDDFDIELMPGMSEMWRVLVSKDDDPGLPEMSGFRPVLREGDLSGDPVEEASSLADEGRFAEAAALLDEAISEDPDYAEAYSVKAMMMAKLGRHEEAVACVDQVLRLRPDDVEDLGVKGMLLERVGYPEEALECYERMIRVAPGEMIAHHLKCGVLALRGEAEKVRECYIAALAAAPSDGGGVRRKSAMRREYRKLEKFAESAGSLDRGLERFMKKVGVGARPTWGRSGEAGRPRSRGARPGGRLRAGRR